MPNWCSNRVTAWSDSDDAIKEFKDTVSRECSGVDIDGPWSRHEPFSFEAILPMPSELRDVQSPPTIKTEKEIEEYKKERRTDKCPYITKETSDRLDAEYGDNNWYDWSVNNWGVKWDCTDVSMDDYKEYGEVTYRFETPWGPPEEIYNLLVARFPEVHITWFYDEPGMEFAGYLGDKR